MSSRHLLTVDKAASYRGCSGQTIRNYIAKGYFPAYRSDEYRGIVVDRDEMDSALAALPLAKVQARPDRMPFGKFASVYSLHPDARR